MSDQYSPAKPPPYAPGAYVPGSQPFRTEAPPTAPVGDTGTGFGAGLLVALVFIVVALMAAAISSYNANNMPATSAVPATGTAAPAATANP